MKDRFEELNSIIEEFQGRFLEAVRNLEAVNDPQSEEFQNPMVADSLELIRSAKLAELDPEGNTIKQLIHQGYKSLGFHVGQLVSLFVFEILLEKEKKKREASA